MMINELIRIAVAAGTLMRVPGLADLLRIATLGA